MRGIRAAAALALVPAALWAESHADQGMEAFQQGRYSVALREFREAARELPSDRRVAAFLAMSEAATGACSTALPALDRAAEAAEAEVARLAGLAAARCRINAGEFPAAMSAIASLRARFPGDADVLYTAAKAYMKAFNDATFEMYQKTASSYRVHELSAEIFETQNRYPEAIAEYRKAIEANPSAPDLHFRLGRALLMAGHGDENLESARGEFEAELKLSPEDSASEFQIGQILLAEGRKAEAPARFERALALSPDFPEAMIALARTRVEAGRPAEAIPLLEHAVRLDPRSEPAHYALMIAYRDAGRKQDAAREQGELDKLRGRPADEFNNFLKKLGEKPQQP